ncbi:MAG: ferredoxin [Caldisericia bacterium]
MEKEHKNFDGMGPIGFCICPKCGYKKPHIPGIPCRDEKCPNCGSILVREGSYHHTLIEERKKKNK